MSPLYDVIGSGLAYVNALISIAHSLYLDQSPRAFYCVTSHPAWLCPSMWVGTVSNRKAGKYAGTPHSAL